MSRLKSPAMPPHLEEQFWRGFPRGTRVTDPRELQLQNFPEEDPEHTYPRWDEMIRYWNEMPE